MASTQNPKPNNSIVILYTELAGYTITCIETLSSTYNVTVHIINYPTNSEAPFNFNKTNNLISYYNRNEHSSETIKDLIKKVNPFLIYCAGWGDQDYLKVIRDNKKQIPTLLGFDNQWNGSLKQRLSVLYAKIKITPYFNYAFVPGKLQRMFAQKLGFKNTHIIEGAYSANTHLFNNIYQKTINEKTKKVPHRFIYVGRYVKEKAIEELWKAFVEIQESNPNDWELWCIGTGKIEPIKHPKIKHFGFIQPTDLTPYIEQTSVFILPSHFEPWGVVVHEFAAAGFPLLISHKVGAKEQFLQNDKNGYSFNSNDINEIKQAILKIINKTDKEIIDMGNISHIVAQNITPESWAKSIFSLK